MRCIVREIKSRSCSKVRGGSLTSPEVIFIVILITIDDPIRENDEMSTPIEGTVTQSGRIDRSAQVLGITRMRTIVSPPTVCVREADPTCDDQTEKGEDPVHGSDDSRDMSGSGIANVTPTLLFRLFQNLSNTNSRKFRGPRHGPRGKPRWTMTGANGKERQTTETRQEKPWPRTKSLSVAGGIAQDLPTEQAMHLLAVVHAQRPCASISWTFPLMTLGPSATRTT